MLQQWWEESWLEESGEEKESDKREAEERRSARGTVEKSGNTREIEK